MYFDFTVVLIFVLLGIAFVFGNLLLGWLARPARPSGEKASVYECGEPTIGPSWIRFNSRFYTIALVYLLFDVEVVVLVPAMLVLKEIKAQGFAYGLGALAALGVFLFLLTLGLAYEWYNGNLDWIGREEESRLAYEVREERAGMPTGAPAEPDTEPAELRKTA